MSARIEKVLTAGNADPAGPPVHENNTWVIGDDAEVVVIDPAHDADAVEAVVGSRRVVGVLITHGHWDHIRQAAVFAERHGLVARMNPADRFLWEDELDDAPFDALNDGDRIPVAGVELVAMHTPGHTPGSTSFVVATPLEPIARLDGDTLLEPIPGPKGPDRVERSRPGVVFTGDTLFPGGPGATRWSFSSFDGILASIETRLFVLPDDTVVHPGHGESTTIGAERPHLEDWRARGW